MNRQCHQKQMKKKLCNGFCAFFKSMYVNPDNREKKKKRRKNEQTKKSLYTTKTLLKNQRQHLVDGWVFLFACFLCFSTSFAPGRCPLLILGYGGSTAPGLEGDLVEQ